MIALLAALVLLSAVSAVSEAALARGSAAPLADLAGPLLLPSVLVALLVASLYARKRAASLAMAALALASLAAGRAALGRGPGQPPAQAAQPRLETLVAPREIQPLAGLGAWLYAGEVGAGRLRDVLVISASAPAGGPRREAPRLTYVAEARPGPDLRIGAWRLEPKPARLPLLAADDEIRSITADMAELERRIRGDAGGGEPALVLAAVLLAFAGTGVLVRRSRWPLLGWSAALVIARGALFALGPQGQALATRTLGSAAPVAPTVSVAAAASILVAADLLARDTRPTRRGARHG